MSEGGLTKECVKEIVEDALRDFAVQTLPVAIKEAMADKIEVTFGVDCKRGQEREAIRADMSFLRTLREKASKGGEKVFLVAVGFLGTGFLYWAISKIWPDGQKFFH